MLTILAASALALATPDVPRPSSSAEIESHRALVVTSPEALPTLHDKPRIFLGGSIDMGTAPNWQKAVIDSLRGEDIVILNPRRADWNRAWKPEADNPQFRQQVEWELDALESSDIIILYFSPGSMSPVSLLEMGLHARSGKLIVLCPPGFWRKGNVDITSQKYAVELVSDLPGLIEATRQRLRRLANLGRDQPSGRTPQNR